MDLQQSVEEPTRQHPVPGGAAGKTEARSFVRDLLNQVADEVRRTLTGFLEQGKRQAADRLSSVARGLREIPGAEGEGNPVVARVAGAAAGKVEELSGTIREKDVEEMARAAGAFVKRNRAVIFGSAIVIGFVVAQAIRTGRTGGTRKGSSGTGLH